jgi:hypothetical protein
MLAYVSDLDALARWGLTLEKEKIVRLSDGTATSRTLNLHSGEYR